MTSPELPTAPSPAPASPPRPHHAHWPSRLPHALAVPQTSLWFNLEVSAARFPDRPVTWFLGRAMTYAELRRDALALAGWLQAQGVAKGDRVLVFMPNAPQFLVAVYAILRADAVVVPVNPMNKADEFGHYIADPQARVVLCTAELAPVVAAADAALPAAQRLRRVLAARLADALPPQGVPAEEAPPEALRAWLTADPPLPALPEGTADPRFVRWSDALAAGHTPGPHTAAADDLAMLPYTSGTTGLPKGCMHSHRTLMSNTVGGAWSHFGSESVSLSVVPLFHITGMVYGVLALVYQGATAVLMPRWERDWAARLIARHHVSHWVCIPTMIIDLFGSPNLRHFDLSSLRFLSGGGAAMPQAVAERLRDEFKLTFCEGYGLTETAAPSHGNPPERAKLQCLGMPIFGVDSRVIDPQTLRELPPGEPGEIVTRGPMVFSGYWGHPEATRAAFVEIEGQHFFRTGDIGRMDDEGYFFITDRLKRMINASGFKVWPSEVELLLYRCPLVQEACVVSAPDDYRGETVKAVVVPRAEVRATATPQQVIDWAREHMAAYKVPRVVEFADALPKSASGKVMWRALQDRQWDRAPR